MGIRKTTCINLKLKIIFSCLGMSKWWCSLSSPSSPVLPFVARPARRRRVVACVVSFSTQHHSNGFVPSIVITTTGELSLASMGRLNGLVQQTSPAVVGSVGIHDLPGRRLGNRRTKSHNR